MLDQSQAHLTNNTVVSGNHNIVNMGDIIIVAGGNQSQYGTVPNQNTKNSIIITNDSSKLTTVGSTGSMGSIQGQGLGRVNPPLIGIT